MDLLIEKDGKRTYLSRYKVITTSFEESSPSVKRNNTQIQYRNGNVDFGGWNEVKTIDYVGYYRADDLEDEEYLRERIYALLSDSEGYYITQLKNDNDDRFERPGETSGDYFDKQVNRPSHKRFYVYSSSLESELVGSYGGHVLYKISATFTTMKLPYGESMPRDLEVKPNVPYIGRNLLAGTSGKLQTVTNASYWNYGLPTYTPTITTVDSDTNYIARVWISPASHDTNIQIVWQDSSGTTHYGGGNKISAGTSGYSTWTGALESGTTIQRVAIVFSAYQSTASTVSYKETKLEQGSVVTPYSPAPEDSSYDKWYLDTYYNTGNLVIPYAGTVPCNQLEQGFIVEFTAMQASGNLVITLNGTEFKYNGQVYSNDVFELSGYEYTKNGISVVKDTNKAYFKLLPGVTNKISCSIAGTIKILGYQDLYA